MPLYHDSMYRFDEPAASCWQEMTPPLVSPAPPLEGDRHCEVAIVGAGYTGLSAALHLARDHGIEACVLDAGEPGWGASGRNGGFCCLYPSALTLAQLDRGFGTDATDAFIAGQREAIELVAALAREEGFDIHRRGEGMYEVAHLPSRLAELAHYGDALRRRFGIPARTIPPAEFARTVHGSTEQHGALHTGAGFGLNPLALARGLAGAAARRGARLHGLSRVTAWTREPGGHRLRTAQGSLLARRVIVATNGYTPEDLVPGLAGRSVPVVSNIIATRPLTQDEREAQGWQTDTPCSNTRRLLFYYRTLEDGRFLFGARGDTTGRPADAARMRDWMTRRLGEVFPAWREVPVTHYWRGFVCMSARGTPAVGALDAAGEVLYGLAYHGNGVAAATWTGRLLARIAAGRAQAGDIPAVMRGPAPRIPLAGLRLWYLRAALAWFRVQDARP